MDPGTVRMLQRIGLGMGAINYIKMLGGVLIS